MSAAVIPFTTRTAAKRFNAELRRALAAFTYAAPGWVAETWQDDEGADVAGFVDASRGGLARFVTDWQGRKLALWDLEGDPAGDPVGTFGTGAELVAAVRRMVGAQGGP